jgi:hypothetical protein
MLDINRKLEIYIFENLNAEYLPDHVAACSNVTNDEKENRRYLGTYFPRSFVESYNIYRQIFSKQEAYELYESKDEIHILVVGGGTGGDLIGLLQVLNEIYNNKKIYIHSFDGNDISLRYQRDFIHNFFAYMSKTKNFIQINTHRITFTNLEKFKNQLCTEEYHNHFDIAQSFKFCNELYNSFYNKNVYYEFLEIGEYCLMTNGILLLEDVTIKSNDGIYIPKIMNSQIKNYLQDNNSKFRYIIPKPCGKWYNSCNETNCFSQITFCVSHRYNNDDLSKVTYNLLIKGKLGDKFTDYIGDSECYELANRKYCLNGEYLYNQDFPPQYPCDNAFTID